MTSSPSAAWARAGEVLAERFAASVEADRPVAGIVGEGDCGIGAPRSEYGDRACPDDAAKPGPGGRRKERGGAGADVADAGDGIFGHVLRQRRGEMDRSLDAIPATDVEKPGTIRDLTCLDHDIAARGGPEQHVEHIARGVRVVDDDAEPLGSERPRDVGPNEAGSPGHQDFGWHGLLRLLRNFRVETLPQIFENQESGNWRRLRA